MQINKALVEIQVPAAEKTFDVYIPLDCKMGVVLKLVSKCLSQLSNNKYESDDNSVLCDAHTGIIFNNNLFINELGIKNGSKIILI